MVDDIKKQMYDVQIQRNKISDFLWSRPKNLEEKLADVSEAVKAIRSDIGDKFTSTDSFQIFEAISGEDKSIAAIARESQENGLYHLKDGGAQELPKNLKAFVHGYGSNILPEKDLLTIKTTLHKLVAGEESLTPDELKQLDKLPSRLSDTKILLENAIAQYETSHAGRVRGPISYKTSAKAVAALHILDKDLIPTINTLQMTMLDLAQKSHIHKGNDIILSAASAHKNDEFDLSLNPGDSDFELSVDPLPVRTRLNAPAGLDRLDDKSIRDYLKADDSTNLPAANAISQPASAPARRKSHVGKSFVAGLALGAAGGAKSTYEIMKPDPVPQVRELDTKGEPPPKNWTSDMEKPQDGPQTPGRK